MDVFLDLVAVGRTDTLEQIVKVDKTSSGKQLAALLAMMTEETASELKVATRAKLSKNAYALMRLGRYKQAAAAFLCASPPFMKVTYRICIFFVARSHTLDAHKHAMHRKQRQSCRNS